MEEELKIVTLEDELEYAVIDEIEDNDAVYIYLTNLDDEKDFCIRKTDMSRKQLNGLDSDTEFDKAILLFTKKHKDDDLSLNEE